MRRSSGLSLRTTYVLSLSLLALLSVVGHLMLTVQMRATENDAHLVNLVGRQRMLSQRVAWDASRLGSGEEQASALRADLRRHVADMRAAHARLTGTAPAGLEPRLRAFLAAADRVAAAPAGALRPGSADVAFLEAQAAGPLLNTLEAAAGQVERRNAALLQQLGWLSWVRLGVVLGVLAALGWFLFRPLERRLQVSLSELRRERDLANRLLERMAQGVAVTDPAGRYTYVNPAYAGLLGRPSAEILGRDQRAFLAPEAPPLSAAGRGGPASRGLGEGFRTTLERPGGTRVPAWVTQVPLVLEGGEGTLAVITDLTERDAAEAALTRAARHAGALLDVSRLAEADLTPEEVARRAAQIVARAAGVDWGGLIVVRGERAEAVTVWHRPGLPQAFRDVLARGLRYGEGLVWSALDRQTPLFVDDYAAAGGALPLAGVGLGAGAWAPLGRLPEGAFVLTALRLDPAPPWTAQDRELFEAAARSVGVALERRSHLRELEAAVWTDMLTELGNRRAFERDLSSTLAAARRHGEAFGVLILDLDGFKAINDRFGHARGDMLLQAFARGLTQTFRAEDQVYRLGGDEFAVLLARADRRAVRKLLDRVAQVAAGLREAGFAGTGASAGAAFYPADGGSLTEIVKLADERMYEHKQDQALLRAGASVLQS